jgi:hypothetical protein
MTSGQLHAPAALPWGKNPQYPLDRRLDGLQSQELWLLDHRYGLVTWHNKTKYFSSRTNFKHIISSPLARWWMHRPFATLWTYEDHLKHIKLLLRVAWHPGTWDMSSAGHIIKKACDAKGVWQFIIQTNKLNVLQVKASNRQGCSRDCCIFKCPMNWKSQLLDNPRMVPIESFVHDSGCNLVCAEYGYPKGSLC